MPRKAREVSKSGIYHVMLRGINKQTIFEDDEDFIKFLWILHDGKEKSGFILYAYCLMGNHAHLLMMEKDEPLQTVFKRIGGRYVYWFNTKYQRDGHLFQDRFKSEPIEDNRAFLKVLRYIHNNPVKAGICTNPYDYKYSSYREYVGNPTFVSTDFAFKFFTKQLFIEFHEHKNDDRFLEMPEAAGKPKYTDEQARAVIAETTGCKSVSDFQKLKPREKEDYIIELYKQGITISQLSRLTGVCRNSIKKFIA